MERRARSWRPTSVRRALANFAGFLLVFCGVLLLGRLVSFVVGKFLRVTGLSIFDHLLGAAFGALRGLSDCGGADYGASWRFPQGDKPPASVVHSRMAPYVVDAARVFAAMAPHELREGFRKTYGQVKAAWGKALDRGNCPSGKGRNERKI